MCINKKRELKESEPLTLMLLLNDRRAATLEITDPLGSIRNSDTQKLQQRADMASNPKGYSKSKFKLSFVVIFFCSKKV